MGWKNYIFLGLVLALLISASFVIVGAQNDKVQLKVTNLLKERSTVPVAIKFRESTSFPRGILASNALSSTSLIKEKLSNVYIPKSESFIYGKVDSSALEDLRNNPLVESITFSPLIHALDDVSNVQINATALWPRQLVSTNLTGAGQTICIIDTGVNYTHPDLGGCSQASFLAGTCAKVLGGYDFVNEDNNPMDDRGHGTHVAGIAAANGSLMGVAPDVRLIIIKALDSTGTGTFTNLDRAIEWCVNNATFYNISVISMSVGTDASDYSSNIYCDDDFPTTTRNISKAISKNITVVIASGNDGSTTEISAPGCIQNATTVGSVGSTDAFSSFGNRNSLTDLVAPGESINSTMISGPTGALLTSCGTGKLYCQLSGTSMSTPHVAAEVALLQQAKKLQSNISLTQLQVETALKNFGKNLTDTGGSGLKFPRIDVYKSVDSLTFPIFTWIEKPNLTLANLNVTINLTASDTLLGVQSANITINSTQYVMNVSGSSFFFVYTVPNVQNVSYNITFFDSAQSNTTETVLLQIGDSTPPVFSNVSSLNLNYSLTTVFNISWQDNLAISNVWIEFNGTNYTGANITNVSSIYSFNRSIAAGNYTLRWYANDTSNDVNFTSLMNVTILPLNPILNLTFLVTGNTYTSDIFIDNDTSVNITATSIGEGKIDIYRNGSLIGRDPLLISNLTNFSSTVYNITAIYNATQNYSASFITYFITAEAVNQPPAGLKISPANNSYRNSVVTFTISANDTSLANATIFIFNPSRAVVDINSTNLTGNYNTTSWNYSLGDLGDGNYTWDVRLTDNRSNKNFTAQGNFTVVVDLTKPTNVRLRIDDTSITTAETTNINCSGFDINLESAKIFVDDSVKATNSSGNITTYLFPTHSAREYNISCLIKDLAGNVQSQNDTITVTATASSSSSNTGSSSTSSNTGGGSTADNGPPTAVYFFPQLAAAQTAKVITSVNAKNITGISAVVITLKNPASNVTITVKNATTGIDKSLEGTNRIYHYLEIDHVNLNNLDISQVNITFEVRTSWLTKNNVSKQNVTLKRYVNGTGWEKIPTINITDTSSLITYKAVSKGLSIFAIAAETAAQSMTQTNTTASGGIGTSSVGWTSKLKINWTYVGVSLAVLIVIGLLAAYFLLGNKKSDYRVRKVIVKSGNLDF